MSLAHSHTLRLYRITFRGFKSYGQEKRYKFMHVVANHPSDAEAKAWDFLGAKEIDYSEASVQKIELLAEHYQYTKTESILVP